ncbi:MAG: hypothetical protein GTN93_32555 [Anaerolineae bacterium]|nr:hypothetical protein [Anaerolineae bacterium]
MSETVETFDANLDGVELEYTEDDLDAVTTKPRIGEGTYLFTIVGVYPKVDQKKGHMKLPVRVLPTGSDGNTHGPAATLYLTIPARTPVQVLKNENLPIDLQEALPSDWHLRTGRRFVNAVAPGAIDQWPLFDRTSKSWSIDGDPVDDDEDVKARQKLVARQVGDFMFAGYKNPALLTGKQFFARVSYREGSDFPDFDRITSQEPTDAEVVDFV